MSDNDKEVVINALLAAGVLALVFEEEGAQDKFAYIGAMLVQGVQWRHRPALGFRLGMVADLVENRPWFLSAERLADLSAGLGKIAEDTHGTKGNDQDGVIAIRTAAASLASTLSEYCRESRLDEPQAIRIWRQRCSDPDEFSEVRNSWRADI